MELKEKILIFRTCGMVLWVLKEIVDHSRIDEATKKKIVSKVNDLIEPMTDRINDLRAKDV